jgi:hypothetical protein
MLEPNLPNPRRDNDELMVLQPITLSWKQEPTEDNPKHEIALPALTNDLILIEDPM